MKWKQAWDEKNKKKVIGISKLKTTRRKTQKSLRSAMKWWGTYQTVFQIYHTQIHDAHKNIKIPSIEFYIFRFPLSFYDFLYKTCLPCSEIAAKQIVQIGSRKNNSNLNLTSLVSAARLISQEMSSHLPRDHKIIIHDSLLSFIYHSSDETRHQIHIIMEIYSKKKY